jgi:DNA-binding LacI/PurR family transcriptional regulator/DNA-binding transcriptional regulator YhcF (GntR family)
MTTSISPLYIQVANKLRDELKRYKPGEAFYSDRDVARIHGISFLTARNAVLQLVQSGQLNRVPRKGTYVRDPEQTSVDQIKTAPTTSIDAYRLILYLPHSSIVDVDPYYSNLYSVCSQDVKQAGGDMVFSSLQSVNDAQILPVVIKERGEKGVFLAGPVGESLCKRLKAISGLNVVAIDHDYSHLGIDSVVWNLHEVGRQSAIQLLEAGHRELAFVGEPIGEELHSSILNLSIKDQWPNSHTFCQGFKQGIEDWQVLHAVKITHSIIIDSWEIAIERLTSLAGTPTGYVCFSGEYAAKIAEIVEKKNGTCAGNDFICWSNPTSTKGEFVELVQTLAPKASVLGHAAVTLMNNRIKNPTAAVQRESLLPVRVEV